MRLTFLSTPVGPLGSGIGGGVELTLRTLAREFTRRGHEVVIVAPSGSRIDHGRLIDVEGALHVPSQTLDRSIAPVVPRDSVLVAMWRVVMQLAGRSETDLVVNFAYDALPFEEARSCPVPVMHLVSMGSLSDQMDGAVRDEIRRKPGCIAMHSRAQATTFGSEVAVATTIVGSGIDLARYDFVAESGNDLAFVGRISPEKGIDDVFAVAARSGRTVRAFGVMEDAECWESASLRHPGADVRHEGFLATPELQRQLGACAALLMLHKWVEAFGNVAIEALACGVPVIAYDRGGPVEIVRHGRTGFVVPPDDVGGVVEAIGHLGEIDRHACRADVQDRFSAEAFALRVEHWLNAALRGV